MRRLKVEMKKLIRDLLIVTMLGIVSVGAFAQKKDDRRPDKVPANVNTKEKDKPPPKNDQPKPQNRNRPS
jgi:hypothetical protein